MTAAQAVAARAGAPLGGDYAVLSLSDRLKPWAVIEDRLRAVAAADLVIAIYNPASRTRTTQVKEAKEILLEYRAAETPVVVGRDVGRAGEELIVTNARRSRSRRDRHALPADHRGPPNQDQPERRLDFALGLSRAHELVGLVGQRRLRRRRTGG